MTDPTKPVQGIAVYAEFQKPGGATMMMMVTPDGHDSEGKRVAASIYRRVVTPSTPRRQWRHSSLGLTALEFTGTSVPSWKKDEFSEDRLRIARSLFDGLLNGGWNLVGQPIYVEVSKKDLDDVNARKTPTKLIYRVNQSRTALGFPAAA